MVEPWEYLAKLGPSISVINQVLSFCGIFVFAISGAVAGIRRNMDFFGVIVLAVAASNSGGIIRDVLIGALPPANLQTSYNLFAALLAAVVTFYFFSLVNRLTNPVEFFDAIGLGVFTVIGAEKAVLYGITPPWAVLLGIITGVGGGVMRDILLAQVPTILRAEIYATASLLGAIIVVVTYQFPVIPPAYGLITGAVLCTGLRLLALHYRWHINIPPPSGG